MKSDRVQLICQSYQDMVRHAEEWNRLLPHELTAVIEYLDFNYLLKSIKAELERPDGAEDGGTR